MRWFLLLAGGIIGGVLSAYSRRDRDNVLLRAFSFIVPFGCTVGFWLLEYKSGGSLQNISKLTSDIVTVVLTSVLCWGISKGIGVLIVGYIDTKK